MLKWKSDFTDWVNKTSVALVTGCLCLVGLLLLEYSLNSSVVVAESERGDRADISEFPEHSVCAAEVTNGAVTADWSRVKLQLS